MVVTSSGRVEGCRSGGPPAVEPTARTCASPPPLIDAQAALRVARWPRLRVAVVSEVPPRRREPLGRAADRLLDLVGRHPPRQRKQVEQPHPRGGQRFRQAERQRAHVVPRFRHQATRPERRPAPVSRLGEACRDGAHDPSRGVAAPMYGTAATHALHSRPPIRALARAVFQYPERRVQLREYPGIDVAQCVGRKRGKVIQQAGKAEGMGEKKEDQILAAPPIVALGTGRDDDAVVVPTSSSGAGNQVLPGQWLARAGARSTVGAAAGSQVKFKLLP